MYVFEFVAKINIFPTETCQIFKFLQDLARLRRFLFVETVCTPSLPAETYRITNLMGQTLMTGQMAAETQQIDVSDLPQGMYFITFAGETRKFVVR